MQDNPLKTNDITVLLQRWRNGDDTAMDALLPLIYDDLYSRARFYMSKERRNHTLSVTALVNEAFMKLVLDRDRDWKNRVHFYSVAATVMRNLLIHYADARSAQKRGSEWVVFQTDDLDAFRDVNVSQFPMLNEALNEMAAKYPRQTHVAELYYFCGFSLDEVADIMAVARATVNRDLQFGRAWLRTRLKDTRL